MAILPSPTANLQTVTVHILTDDKMVDSRNQKAMKEISGGQTATLALRFRDPLGRSLWCFRPSFSVPPGPSVGALGPHPPSSAWVIILYSPLMPQFFSASGHRPPSGTSGTSGCCPLVRFLGAFGLYTPSSA